jgi:hypothetical protein
VRRILRRGGRAGAAALAAVAAVAALGGRGPAWPAALGAQTVVSPSAHFGASAYPDIEPATYVGLNLDRFTRFGKEVDDAGNFLWAPYNGIDRTIGLNTALLSLSAQSRRAPSVIYRMVAQVGYSANEPTKGVQNFIHDRMNLRHVPDSLVREGFDFGAALDATRWTRIGGPRLRWVPPAFVGGGVSLSTVHQEAFVQTGLRSFVRASRPLGVSLMVRAGVVAGGSAFPDRALERAYASAQASTQLGLWQLADRYATNWPPVLRWLSVLVPDVELSYSTDTGFFRGLNGKPLPETFIAGRASWLDDLVHFETWNDTINDKDQGPTGGGRVFVRLPTVAPQSWLP